MLIIVSADGRNMYAWHQLNLGAIAKAHKSPPKALLQRNSLRWAALAANHLVNWTIVEAIQDETVRHVETTLARSLFNCDEL